MHSSGSGLVETVAGPGLASLLVAGVLVLLVAGALSLTVVAPHERAVVTRLGRVARVVGPGVVVRIPVVDRLGVVSMRPAQLTMVAHATTRDGVQVRVMATARCRTVDPETWVTGSAADPLGATVTVVEERLAHAVAHLEVAGLLDAREQLENEVSRDASVLTSAWGVEVSSLEVADVETRLTAELLRSRQRRG